jgi:hypothetical protein
MKYSAFHQVLQDLHDVRSPKDLAVYVTVRPPLYSTLNQIDVVHTLPPHFIKIHFNIILRLYRCVLISVSSQVVYPIFVTHF